MLTLAPLFPFRPRLSTPGYIPRVPQWIVLFRHLRTPDSLPPIWPPEPMSENKARSSPGVARLHPTDGFPNHSLGVIRSGRKDGARDQDVDERYLAGAHRAQAGWRIGSGVARKVWNLDCVGCSGKMRKKGLSGRSWILCPRCD